MYVKARNDLAGLTAIQQQQIARDWEDLIRRLNTRRDPGANRRHMSEKDKRYELRDVAYDRLRGAVAVYDLISANMWKKYTGNLGFR